MAVVDYFLKIDGIPGESQDSKHKNEIDLLSWGWSEENRGTSAAGGGAGAGKVSMADFSFKQKVNKSSPKLFLNCASGTHIKSALLTARKAGKTQQEYLKITFSDLLISSYKIGPGADAVSEEEITFNFSKIEYSYAAQKADGTLDSPVVHNWSVQTNTGS